jgi:cell wall-associated NlpC family hydrolase
MTRADLITEARRWVGTPWVHQGRTARGLDCVGLLVVCAQALGIPVEDKADYGREPVGQSLMSHLSSYLTPAPRNEILPGRVGVFTESRFPCHVGVFSEVSGNLYLIHAYARRRKVVEEPFVEGHRGLRLIGSYDVTALTQEQ